MGLGHSPGKAGLMQNALWWRDFEFRGGVVTVKKTGARLRIGPGLLGEVANWFAYYFVVEAWRLRALGRRGPKIWFTPDRPRPWYLVWPVMHAAGARMAKKPEEADLVFFFDDVTESEPPETNISARLVNFHCDSISKSRVAQVFEEVFGYGLEVDPTEWAGPMVEKSEVNAAHDGRIVHGPCEARPGRAYQRVIDNSYQEGLVEDLRCPTLGGEIPIVFRKRRRLEDRFLNINSEVETADTADVFSADEQKKLGDFARAMRLDWGSLDVLRDKNDGRLYVVDVNKTDMGPPTALPLGKKIKATSALARAFARFLDTQSNQPTAS
jgi:hypothetical protein